MAEKFFSLKMSEKPKTLDLYIYSDVEENTTDLWTGEKIESSTSAEHFRKELEAAGDVEQINVYINSNGGSVMEGTAIYNQLKRHKAYKTVYIDGFACSIASVIAMAGDTVIMPRNAVMMIHNPWTITAGNAEQLRKTADDLDKITEAASEAYLQKAGEKLTKEKLAELMAAETYLTAEECVSYGLADEFARADNDSKAGDRAKEQAQKQFNASVENAVKKFFNVKENDVL